MHNKTDFGSILLILIFIALISFIIYIAGSHFLTNFNSNITNVSMYSYPTWSELTTTTTTTSSEEIEEEETSEEYEEDEDNEE